MQIFVKTIVNVKAKIQDRQPDDRRVTQHSPGCHAFDEHEGTLAFFLGIPATEFSLCVACTSQFKSSCREVRNRRTTEGAARLVVGLTVTAASFIVPLFFFFGHEYGQLDK